MRQQITLEQLLGDAKTVAIAGHVNPDGDCIGSVMGIWLYLRDHYPQIKVTAYLESYREVFSLIEGIDQAKDRLDTDEAVDLLILTDISSHDRIGVAAPLLETAGRTLCFDHHITNTDEYTTLFNDPQASSTCEVICRFLDMDKISPACAAALYTGIVSDSGVFRYESTAPETMRVAASLMEKGIPFAHIIDETFYRKTFAQNRIMGKVVEESTLHADGKLIVGKAFHEDMLRFGVEAKDMDGIVSELRNTCGIEVAALLYERSPGIWKISLRSCDYLDVSAIAGEFGGGGHVRAAGCTIEGDPESTEEALIERIEAALCLAEKGRI